MLSSNLSNWTSACWIRLIEFFSLVCLWFGRVLRLHLTQEVTPRGGLRAVYLSGRPDAHRDCGLHSLLSARKRQLTCSFCYGLVFSQYKFLLKLISAHLSQILSNCQGLLLFSVCRLCEFGLKQSIQFYYHV